MEYNEKQLHLMETAEKLFAEKGFAGTSVRDIAEAAVVNLATISYYFGSKEKLMEAMFKYRGEYLKLRIQNLLQDDQASSLQKMERLVEDYITRIFERRCFHMIMIREQRENATGPISDQIYQLKQTNMQLIGQLIREGQDRGEFKPDIDIPFLMMTLVGTTSQLVTSQHLYRRVYDLQSMPDDEFEAQIKQRLINHIKQLFKAILINEK